MHSDPDQFARSAMEQPGRPLDRQVIFPRPWREPSEQARLTVSYHCDSHAEGPALHAAVEGVRVPLSAPVLLQPVEIDKPWGREIWFTGMERRGESRVCGTDGTLPLGDYLALAPEHVSRGLTPLLLKILDPLPEPVIGELYLEVHETKREVYVVTGLNPDLWPAGRGRIRYGINQQQRRSYGDDEAFRAAFLDAARDYESLRRAVDEGHTGLKEAEQAAREATARFVDLLELRVGDVISVPRWVPHSLQPGVQVVEFQTPTYERLIVTSTQKVLTQEGWDSAAAIDHMDLDQPQPHQPEPVASGVERIARFDDFNVWRAELGGGGTLIPTDGLPYAVAFCISGTAALTGPGGSLTIRRGQAAFVPAAAAGNPITSGDDALLLLAAPGL